MKGKRLVHLQHIVIFTLKTYGVSKSCAILQDRYLRVLEEISSLVRLSSLDIKRLVLRQNLESHEHGKQRSNGYELQKTQNASYRGAGQQQTELVNQCLCLYCSEDSRVTDLLCREDRNGQVANSIQIPIIRKQSTRLTKQ